LGRATRGGEATFAAVVASVFFALVLVGALRHEMWRDELEVWLIARDSGSLGELWAHMATEVHPAPWYLLNYSLARLTVDPRSMQVLHVLIATAAAYLFARHAPLGRLHRTLFCFGYYAFYEFGVISRNYALQLLCTFVFCTLLEARRGAWLRLGLILALLAQTHLYGTIVAASLSSVLLAEVLAGAREAARPALWAGAGALLLAWAGVAAGLGHVLLQALRIGPSHDSFVPGMDLRWVLDSLSTIYRGYVPLPNLGDPHPWNTNILDVLPQPGRAWLMAGLGVALLVLSWLGLRQSRRALIVFLLGSGAMLMITFVLWRGWLRQQGQVYLLFVVAVWLCRAGEPPTRARRVGPLVTVVLALQAVAGAYAFAIDLGRPFSRARDVGRYLSRPEFRDVTLVGSHDYAAQPIAAYVDAQIYYPQTRRFGTFVTWGAERQLVTSKQVLDEAVGLLRSRGKDVVVVLNYEVKAPRQGEVVPYGPDVRVEGLARFEGAIVDDENYFVYRFTRSPR
jgi:hypothetical protein